MDNYSIDPISYERFSNISRFVFNSKLKKGIKYENSETEVSSFLWNLYSKYTENRFKLTDLIELRTFVTNFNTAMSERIMDDVYEVIFGLTSENEDSIINREYEKVQNLILKSMDSSDEDYEIYKKYLEENNISKVLTFIQLVSYLQEENSYSDIIGDLSSSNIGTDGENLKSFYERDSLSKYLSGYDINQYYGIEENENEKFSLTDNVVTLIDEPSNLNPKEVKYSLNINLDGFKVKVPLVTYLKGDDDIQTEIERFVTEEFSNKFVKIHSNETVIEEVKTSTSLEDLQNLIYKEIYSYLITEKSLILRSSGNRNLLSTIISDFNNMFRIGFNKELIFFNQRELTPNINRDKLTFSFNESTDMSRGEPLLFFDISVNTGTITDQALKDTFQNVFNTEAQNVHFTVLYKELNLAYRETLMIDLMEVFFHLMLKNNNYQPSKLTNFDEFLFPDEKLNVNINNILRQTRDTTRLLIESDEHEANLIKYQRGNSVLARKALESSIIVFYYGDNIISKNYGRNSTEITEIHRFLETFDKTREIFYKVLYNSSFSQDEYYDAFVKIFISIISIQRFLDVKNDETKNIDTFNKTDISNFLRSYGLSSLDMITDIDEKYFWNKEIIKNFNNLVKNKGTIKVLEDLINIFKDTDIDIEVTKHYLTEVFGDEVSEEFTFEVKTNNNISIIEIKFGSETIIESQTQDEELTIVEFIKNERDIYEITPISVLDNKNEDVSHLTINELIELYEGKGSLTFKVNLFQEDKSLRFIPVPYSHKNLTKELLSSLEKSSSDYSSFINKDPYWDIDNVKESDLFNKNLNVEDTKYLSLKVFADDSTNFTKSRYILSALDLIYENFLNDDDRNLLKRAIFTVDELNGEISLGELYGMLRGLYNNLIYLYTKRGYEGYDKTNGDKYIGLNPDVDINTTKLYSTLLYHNIWFPSGGGNLKDSVFTRKMKDQNGTEIDVTRFDKNYKFLDDVKYTNIVKEDASYGQYEDIGNFLNGTIQDLYSKLKITYASPDNSNHLNEVLENLNFILLKEKLLFAEVLRAYENSTEHNIDIYNNLLDDGIIPYEIVFKYLIDKMIKFPLDLHSGSLQTKTREKNDLYVDVLDAIYEDFYTTENDPMLNNLETGIFTSQSNAYFTFGDVYKEVTYNDPITVLEEYTSPGDYFANLSSETFSSIVDSVLVKIDFINDILRNALDNKVQYLYNLNIFDQGTVAIEYLKAAMEMFVSFRNSIYEANYAKRFKSQGETVMMGEKVKLGVTKKFNDYMFISDNIEIEKIKIEPTLMTIAEILDSNVPDRIKVLNKRYHGTYKAHYDNGDLILYHVIEDIYDYKGMSAYQVIPSYDNVDIRDSAGYNVNLIGDINPGVEEGHVTLREIDVLPGLPPLTHDGEHMSYFHIINENIIPWTINYILGTVTNIDRGLDNNGISFDLIVKDDGSDNTVTVKVEYNGDLIPISQNLQTGLDELEVGDNITLHQIISGRENNEYKVYITQLSGITVTSKPLQVNSISDLFDLTEPTMVKVQGTLTGKTHDDERSTYTAKFYTIQDETGAIILRDADGLNRDLTDNIGEEITFIGEYQPNFENNWVNVVLLSDIVSFGTPGYSLTDNIITNQMIHDKTIPMYELSAIKGRVHSHLGAEIILELTGTGGTPNKQVNLMYAGSYIGLDPVSLQVFENAQVNQILQFEQVAPVSQSSGETLIQIMKNSSIYVVTIEY